MKVELDDLRLAMSGLTERVMVGTPDRYGRSFTKQKDVTSDFHKAVIEFYGGKKTTINGGDKKYEITCKEIN